MSRNRAWALAAHQAVLRFAKDDSNGSKYRTLCKKTPALIQQSGLAQALVFLHSRDNEIGKDFVNQLAKTYQAAGAHRQTVQDGKTLIEQALTESDLQKYLLLSSELSAVAVWFRRFAQVEEFKDSKDSSQPTE